MMKMSVRQSVPVIDKESRIRLLGMPLWHICTDVHKGAHGIIAIGLRARGILSIGCFSIGVVSIGSLSVGIVSLGALSAGVLALGAIAAGVIAVGSVSIGCLCFGAAALGRFSFGAAAVGQYAAIGDSASGMVALGTSEASGRLFEHTGVITPQAAQEAIRILNENIPARLRWAGKVMQFLLEWLAH